MLLIHYMYVVYVPIPGARLGEALSTYIIKS